MTHPHPGHGANQFEIDLSESRAKVVGEAPLPPREAGFTAVAADYVTRRKASQPGEHYEEYLRDPNDGYLHDAAEFVYDKHFDDGTYTDNKGIVGDLMEEFHQKYNREFDGEFDDDEKTVSDGRYSEFYEDTKWKRRAKKLGAKAATVTGSVATGVTLYAVSPGFFGGAAAVAGTTAAAYGSKVYIPSPKEHRVIIEETFKDDKVSQIQTSVARQLERLGFGDNEAQRGAVSSAAALQASRVKISVKDKLSSDRKTYLEEKRKILRGLRNTVADPLFDDSDLEWLRVDTAAKLTWLELQKATNEAMKKKRTRRGLGRVGVWGAGMIAGAVIAANIHAGNVQEEERLQQIDPIHHGDTSNEVNGDYVDNFLPGPGGSSVTITTPPTSH